MKGIAAATTTTFTKRASCDSRLGQRRRRRHSALYFYTRHYIVHRGEVPDEMKTYFSEGGRRHRHRPRPRDSAAQPRPPPTRRLVINYYFGASDVGPAAAVQWRLRAPQVRAGFREFSISR